MIDPSGLVRAQVRSVELLVRSGSGRTLLQMRDGAAATFPLRWSFWGGAVERGDETLAHAAARELGEELQVVAAPEAFTLVAKRVAGSGRTAPLFRLDRLLAWQDIVVREGAGAGWFTRDELRALQTTPSVTFHLRHNPGLFGG